MRLTIEATPLADGQIQALRGDAKTGFWAHYHELENLGCAAADYRLWGDGLDRLCAVHFYADWRAIVAFPSRKEITVLMVGEHERGSSMTDVYANLYAAMGIEVQPGSRVRRDCCDDDGAAPVDSALVERFIATSKDFERNQPKRRKRAKRARRGRASTTRRGGAVKP